MIVNIAIPPANIGYQDLLSRLVDRPASIKRTMAVTVCMTQPIKGMAPIALVIIPRILPVYERLSLAETTRVIKWKTNINSSGSQALLNMNAPPAIGMARNASDPPVNHLSKVDSFIEICSLLVIYSARYQSGKIELYFHLSTPWVVSKHSTKSMNDSLLLCVIST